MAKNDTITKTITVATVLCIVCSVIVSTAAVMLKPAQERNKELDFKRNILAAADMRDPSVSIEEQFEQIEVRVINFETGEFTDEVSADTYDQRAAANDAKLSKNLSKDEDIVGIGRQEKYGKVYMVRNEAGELDKIVLPIRGYGLWSTLYGFIALEEDFNTVVGLTYYEHGETPGLGGEVDNPKWKAIWEGKQVYDDQGDVELSVIKGTVDKSQPGAKYKVDGLSGATLTSNGVDYMIDFWMGKNGYKPFLQNLKEGEA